jgi:hypothetical protein
MRELLYIQRIHVYGRQTHVNGLHTFFYSRVQVATGA